MRSSSIDAESLSVTEALQASVRALAEAGEYANALEGAEALLMVMPTLELAAIRVACLAELGRGEEAISGAAAIERALARPEIVRALGLADQARAFRVLSRLRGRIAPDRRPELEAETERWIPRLSRVAKGR
jgi:hypothetical protein